MAKKNHYYNKTTPREEAFRTLRTNISFSAIDKNLKTIVVTSTNPNEGKTSIAIDLTRSLVKNGDRVILIDCDLRNPTVAKRLEINHTLGLTNVLVKNMNYEDVMIQHEGINLILSGPIPPNPPELVGSKKMEDFLASIYERFDYIILDTPPAGMLTDAAILSRSADGTLVIVAEGETEKRDLARTFETIENVGGNIIGVVMTKVKSVKQSGYGKYY